MAGYVLDEAGNPASSSLTGNNKIFIQIAAYRDPELLPTLHDCLAKAAHPERLNFGIAWQHDEHETLAEFRDDPRFRILDIDWRDSKGVCWARHALQGLYAGEEYTLALDSHHRFEPNWDRTLKAQLAMCPSRTPVLTSYVPAYDPTNPDLRDPTPYGLAPDAKSIEKVLLYRPYRIENYQQLTAPIPTAFFSAHFTFSRGAFLADCRHDPALYFHGEEISLAVRAFTHGWDLFHPHRTTIYHQYTREGQPKHWNDHPFVPGKAFGHNLINRFSIKRVQTMLGMRPDDAPIDFGAYGLGAARSLSDYEAFAGVNFRFRALGDKWVEKSLGEPRYK